MSETKKKPGRKPVDPSRKAVKPNVSMRLDLIKAAESAAEKRGIGLSEFIAISVKNQLDHDLENPPINPAKFIVGPYQAHRPVLLAAAGSPIGAEVMDWDGDGDTVVVKACGLSMSPLIEDGEIVTMKHKRQSRSPYLKKGLIYLVNYDGGYTIKRYNTRPAKPEEKGEEWVERGKVKVLESVNPDYPEIVIKQPLEWVAWM